jgi:hypothetical protein
MLTYRLDEHSAVSTPLDTYNVAEQKADLPLPRVEVILTVTYNLTL